LLLGVYVPGASSKRDHVRGDQGGSIRGQVGDHFGDLCRAGDVNQLSPRGDLVIDLTPMRHVQVTGDIATVGGGARSGDVMAAAQEHGLAVAVGTVGAVGMTGLALGGGYGPLCGTTGLVADTIVGADVVLADGRFVSADQATEPDLFWALRGGGGNFGVVTALRLRLHPVPTVLTGMVLFGWDQAAEILSGFAALAADAPDELAIQAGAMSFPGAGPVVYLIPTWSGKPAAGHTWIERIAALGQPLAADSAEVSPLVPLQQGDQMFTAERRNYRIATRNLAALTPPVVAALIGAAEQRTSPLSGINMHHFHGAATRVPVTSTSFGLRDEHFMVEIIGSGPADDAGDHEWVALADRELQAHAMPGGYPNLLGPDAQDQVRHAYGPNATRLIKAKKEYDPGNVFSAIPLPPPAG
jgi:FAD/FMN-containing dehydrogenase